MWTCARSIVRLDDKCQLPLANQRKTLFLKCALALQKNIYINKSITGFYTNVKVVQRKHYFVQYRFLKSELRFRWKINTHAYVFIFVREKTCRANLICTSCSHLF